MESPLRKYFRGEDPLPPSLKEIKRLFPNLHVRNSRLDDFTITLGENTGTKWIDLWFRKKKILVRLGKYTTKYQRTKIINSDNEFDKMKKFLINFLYCPTSKLRQIKSWNDESEKKFEWEELASNPSEERWSPHRSKV